MPITIFLEIAIGIVSVWLFLALAVMAIQEWRAAILNTRAKDLQSILRGILEDPAQVQAAGQSVQTIVHLLYEHPMIQSLAEPLTARQAARLQKRKENGKPIQRAMEFKDAAGHSSWRWLPSYIPTQTFALALFDVVTTAGTEDSAIQEALSGWQQTVDATIASLQTTGTLPESVQQDWAAIQPVLTAALDDLKAAVQPQLSQAEITAQLNVKVAQLQAAHPQIVPILAQLKPMIDDLPQYLLSKEVTLGIAKLAAENGAAQRMLEDLQKQAARLATQGEATIKAFRDSVATWFDNTMDRASGWYKRKAQLFSFLCGIAVAVILNVDSLTVISTLYREPTLRAAVVAEAGTVVQGETPGTSMQPSDVGAKLESLGLPVGWHFADREQCAAIAAQGNSALPIGTRCIVPGDTPEGVEIDGIGQGILFWVLKLFGWGLSGGMAAQGAPFWFDILKKLVNVRSSGTNPTEEKEKQEAKKK
jgi:hypothetical protein